MGDGTERDAGAVVRLAIFAVALALLLRVSRAGSSVLVIQVCFTIFVVAATVWISGQYWAWLAGATAPIRWSWLVAVSVVGVFLILTYYLWQSAGAALAGLLILYFVAGTGVAWLRQSPKLGERRPLLAALLIGLGVACALAGIGLLGTVSATATVVLLAVALLALLPVGVALLSQVFIDRMSNRSIAWSLAFVAAGSAVYVLSTALIMLTTRSRWLLVAIIVLGLLVVALVSTTQADIALVMAAIALLGVTPLPADIPPALKPDQGSSLLVALGDSYISGEGASIYYAGTDEGGGDQCRRSPTAWAAIAGQQRPFGRVEFVACSGARTYNIRTSQISPTRASAHPVEVQKGEAGTQLDQYLKDYGQGNKPTLVVVGVGGNDAGFSTIGLMCLAPGSCDRKAGLWTGSLDQLRQNLRDTFEQIGAVFPSTPIAVIPYPDPVITSGGCTDSALTPRERVFLHNFVTAGLDGIMQQTAAEFGFYYVAGMQQALSDNHLQLCDPLNHGRPGLNFIGLRSVGGIAEQRFKPTNWEHGSLHPNELGHAALLSAFEKWVGGDRPLGQPSVVDVNALPTRLPVQQPAAQRRDTELQEQTTLNNEPQCDLLDTSTKGCRSEGMTWAKKQMRNLLLTKGLLGVLPLAGIWLAAVAFFGLQRRRKDKDTVGNQHRAKPPKPSPDTAPASPSSTAPPSDEPINPATAPPASP